MKSAEWHPQPPPLEGRWMKTDLARARKSFTWACTLDVAAFKPGNVSFDAPGHGMQAALFVASADAAAGPLFQQGLRVGQRIENAVHDSLAVAACNTNLGIILLCAPLAVAFERADPNLGKAVLRHALGEALAELDVADAAGAFRAIAAASPGGLGDAAEQDVRQAPSLGLREAMALAAQRDSIARQYRDSYADLFDHGLQTFTQAFVRAKLRGHGETLCARYAMQHLYLDLLAREPDSHIARQHGEAAAHSVMAQALRWLERSGSGELLALDPRFREWDLALKAADINPGTTADLCVAHAMVVAWLGQKAAVTPAA